MEPVIPADGWHSLETARYLWVDAPDEDMHLSNLLEVAKAQVIAYAPALVEGTAAPTAYRMGQLMQARNIWNSRKVDPSSGGFGEDSFVIRPHPLDWMIKQILRPKRGLPLVG